MGKIIDVERQRKCANEQCQCFIPSTQEYCSEFCSEADEVDKAELRCDCKHASCAPDGAPALP